MTGGIPNGIGSPPESLFSERHERAVELSDELWSELIRLGLSNAAWHVEEARRQVRAQSETAIRDNWPRRIPSGGGGIQ